MRRDITKLGMGLATVFVGLVMCTGCATQVGIAASPSEIYVEVGGAAVVNVVAVMDRGASTVITSGLTITSDDDAIATVTGQVVTGVAEGTTTLSITDGVYSTDATVIVIAAGTLPSELVVTPTSVSCTPESGNTQLQVFAVLGTGASEDVTAQIPLRSSNNSVALVTGDGAVVCVSAGQATISGSYLGFSVQVPVSVGATPPVAINVAPSALTCEVGETRPVQVLASFADGSTTNVTSAAKYSSSNSAVAAALVGQVSCLAEGSATIVASLSGVTDAVDVTVKRFIGEPDELVDVRIEPATIECVVAQTVGIAVIAEYGDGSTVDVTRSNRTAYLTSDTGVALASPGQVFCLDAGAATIQATFGGFAGQATVGVQ